MRTEGHGVCLLVWWLIITIDTKPKLISLEEDCNVQSSWRSALIIRITSKALIFHEVQRIIIYDVVQYVRPVLSLITFQEMRLEAKFAWNTEASFAVYILHMQSRKERTSNISYEIDWRTVRVSVGAKHSAGCIFKTFLEITFYLIAVIRNGAICVDRLRCREAQFNCRTTCLVFHELFPNKTRGDSGHMVCAEVPWNSRKLSPLLMLTILSNSNSKTTVLATTFLRRFCQTYLFRR
jgi:hypothetical protein